MARIRIGINPLTWTNDDMPELGAETPLETCLKEAKEAGYQGMELGNKFPRQSAALLAALKPFGLAVVSGWYSSELERRSADEEIKAVQAHLTLLKDTGATAMVFADTTRAIHGDRKKPLSQRPKLAAGDWPKFGAAVSAVAAHLTSKGMKLAYHHHMGTVVETEAEVDLLMKHTTPDVGLLLDTGHLTFAGADVVGLAKRHAKRIAHVHLKDVRQKVLDEVKAKDLPFLEAVLKGVYTVPGDGCVDYPAVMKVLAESGYQGWLVVEAEQDPKVAHPLTYAKMGFDYAKKTATAAGLL